jgi:WD40-like Beta Propeller Repeat
MVAGSAGAESHTACPHVAGAVAYLRDGRQHLVSLETCADRVVATSKPRAAGLRSAQGHLATIRATRSEQTIVVDGRAILRVHEDRSRVPGGIPGPLGLVMWSPDGRWLFYFVDPMGSASLAADGLMLRALNVATRRTVEVAQTLINDDYVTWCGSTLVFTANGDRLAAHHKRLVTARAPNWRPHALWHDTSRAFGSVACAPGGRSVAVLSQHDIGSNYSFFETHWELWRVGLDGSHRLLDAPPAGYADESPAWSPDGRSLLFVREHKGRGSLELLRDGRVYGPLAELGFSLGYYGHHNWEIAWRR